MAQPPARLGVLTSFGAAPRSPPVPSGPSGALDTSGAGLLCVPMGGGPPASQAARLSETGVAFAGAGRASTETAVAFAGAGRASTETVVAFAGVKWVFLVHFSGAEVMPVSEVPCWGRAVVLLVSTSPRCRALVKSWGCAQVVDGLFMRLLSRPLGVVRIRWGICRRGWCGCGGGCRSLRSRWRPRCRPGRGW